MRPYPHLTEKAYEDDEVHRQEVLEEIADEVLGVLTYYGECRKPLSDEEVSKLQQIINIQIQENIENDRKESERSKNQPKVVPRVLSMNPQIGEYYRRVFGNE